MSHLHKLEKRIALGKILGVDITGQPLVALEKQLADHAESVALSELYERVLAELMKQPTPEQRVDTAITQVQAELATASS